MQFSQNHEENYGASFLGLKKIHQWFRFLTKGQIKKTVLEVFLEYFPQNELFL